MSIVRITVRTFQNEDHANLFLMGAKSVLIEDTKSSLKLNSKIIQNPNQKNQITSIWEYEDEIPVGIATLLMRSSQG